MFSLVWFTIALLTVLSEQLENSRPTEPLSKSSKWKHEHEMEAIMKTDTSSGRQLTLGGSCPSTCWGSSCDYWTQAANGGWTCYENEHDFGCDCSGCACIVEATTPSPTNVGNLCPATCVGGDTCDEVMLASPGLFTCPMLEGFLFGCDCQGCECGDPNESCPATCNGMTCDEQSTSTGLSCYLLELVNDCDCSGCACQASSNQTSDSATDDDFVCEDIDYGATDLYGTGCEWYTASGSESCGFYDDPDFAAVYMCCMCGGGTEIQQPSPNPTSAAPSVTSMPTTTVAPTPAPTESTSIVSTFDELSELVIYVTSNAITGTVIDIVQNVTFKHALSIYNDITLSIFSSVKATLRGGGTDRFFLIRYATLHLESLNIVGGWLDPTEIYESDGGAVQALQSILTMRACSLTNNTAYVSAQSRVLISSAQSDA